MSQDTADNQAPESSKTGHKKQKPVIRSEQDLKEWAEQLKAREAALKKLADELDKRFHKAT